MLKEKDNHGLITKNGVTKATLAEIFTRNKLAMQRVVKLSKELTLSHLDDFSVSVLSNQYLANIMAQTAFEVEFTNGTVFLRLSVGVTKYRNGTTIEKVYISPENGSWSDDDNTISYRLYISTGTEIEEEHERLSEQDEDEYGIRSALLNRFDTNVYEENVLFSDCYAESKIDTKDAITVLENARGFHRPTNFGSISGMSLSQFRQSIKDQSKEDSNINPLPKCKVLR